VSKKIAFTRIRVSNPSYQKIPTKIYKSISYKMNVEEIRDFALSLEDVTESFPFGPETIVFKTNNKMFLLLPLDEVNFLKINVKCDPELAIELRIQYPDSVLPGYHMNKKHWNTVVIDGLLTWKSIKEMIEHSHGLVGRRK
jgi:predicted DNA-binding protein (MmcQ/YjbR family)